MVVSEQLKQLMKPSMSSDGHVLYTYAKYVVKTRWSEAESYIKINPPLAYKYALYIVGDRWLEAEPYIKKDPEYAYWYARCIIGDRWEEAESYIENDDYYYQQYQYYMIELPAEERAFRMFQWKFLFVMSPIWALPVSFLIALAICRVYYALWMIYV